MISGKGASGYINGTMVAGCHKWDAEESGVELDNATSSTGGYENPEIGLKGLTANLDGWFDVGTSSIGPIRVGSEVSNLKLYATDAGAEAGLMATIPLGIVTRLRVSAEVRGKIEFAATIKSKGAYTMEDAAA